MNPADRRAEAQAHCSKQPGTKAVFYGDGDSGPAGSEARDITTRQTSSKDRSQPTSSPTEGFRSGSVLFTRGGLWGFRLGVGIMARCGNPCADSWARRFVELLVHAATKCAEAAVRVGFA